MTWDHQFTELFRRCLDLYQGGNTDFMSYYRKEDLSFLSSIGHQPRELFDFVEDLADEGVPSESTALLIAAVRRDYFLIMQDGQVSEIEVTRDDLPSFDEELGGIAYLPRIMAKAHAKLRGELHPDLMFSCGGDRKFLSENKIHAADFLRHLWSADGDEEK
ncbi:DUF5069 domain-containing protein, partial [Akkermansiaceae bacterium]|nr:DUF5069 domain-containing protein [Akkermansiaceae bacterium]